MTRLNKETILNFAYIQIPKKIIDDDNYKDLPIKAKYLYGLLLSRLKLSFITNETKGSFCDSKGSYLIFTIKQIQEAMNLGSNNTVLKLLKNLEEKKLIYRENIVGKNKKVTKTYLYNIFSFNNNQYLTSEDINNFYFYQLPLAFLNDEKYSKLNNESKLLYSILLDVYKLIISSNNTDYIDNNGDICFPFTIKDIERYMNCAKNKARNLLNNLEEFNLVEITRNSVGKENIIYLNTFWDNVSYKTSNNTNTRKPVHKKLSTSKNDENCTGVQKCTIGIKDDFNHCNSNKNESFGKKLSTSKNDENCTGVQKCTMGSPKNALWVGSKMHSSNIFNINNNNQSDIAEEDGKTLINQFKNIIDYEILTTPIFDDEDILKNPILIDNIENNFKINKLIIDNICDFISELAITDKNINLKYNNMSLKANDIINLLMTLDSIKVEEICYRVKSNLSNIKNIKQYIKTVAIDISKNYDLYLKRQIEKN